MSVLACESWRPSQPSVSLLKKDKFVGGEDALYSSLALDSLGGEFSRERLQPPWQAAVAAAGESRRWRAAAIVAGETATNGGGAATYAQL